MYIYFIHNNYIMNKNQYIRKITLYKIRKFIPFFLSKKILKYFLKEELMNLYNLQLISEKLKNKINDDCFFHISNFL